MRRVDTDAGTQVPNWLLANSTVFVSSLCVMIVEIVAGRAISPYLGQSLYTWTTIIGIVLGGITLGNYAGGRLADRFAPGRLLPALLLAALAGVWAVLPLNTFAGNLRPLWGLGWPTRIFCHVLLVFLLPAALLGTISPAVAKFALGLGRATGRTMGNVYAWGAAGSIAGTALAGFVLVAAFGVKAILFGAGCGLGLLALVHLLWPRHLVTIPSIAEEHRNGAEEADSFSSWLLPCAVVFVASAAMMAVEITAGRVASRHFGQSLYSWTTVIGVVLAGMSAGNYIGGHLADRRHDRASLALMLVLSSAACLIAPAIATSMAVSRFFVGYHLLVPLFATVIAAYFPPSVLLGAVSPFVAGMALRSGGAGGRTLGRIYAWGVAGGLAGTFAAGFWLIAKLGTAGTACAAACLLGVTALALGARYFPAQAWAVVCLITAVAAFAPERAGGPIGRALYLRPTPSPGTVYETESQYSYIGIYAPDPDFPNLRQMFLDKMIHSEIVLDQPIRHRYPYEQIYDAVLDKYYPNHQPLTTLELGGGGYTFPRSVAATRPGSNVNVVEIDPAVTESVHQAFGLPRDNPLHIVHLDARNHVADLLRRKRAGENVPAFDCILGDAFNHYSVPFHLTTREFVESLRALLKPEGIYQFNLIDMLTPGDFVGAVVDTCKLVFPNVAIATATSSETERNLLVVVCSARRLDLGDIPARIRKEYPDYAGRVLSDDDMRALAVRSRGRVLTDDFAPVENLLAGVARAAPHWVFDTDMYLMRIERAKGLMRSGHPEIAIEQCVKALQLRPGSAEGYLWLGNALAANKQEDKAIAAWRDAIRLAPKGSAPYQNLITVLSAKGDRAAARAVLEDARRQGLALDPEIVKAIP